MLQRLFGSGARIRILGVVLFKDGLHLREIARIAGASASETKGELDNLIEVGVLKSERIGNVVIFSVNQKCPFINELISIYMKTEGIIKQLQQAISGISGIKYAFVYGSIPRGNFREKSDLDLFIIGSANDEQIASACLTAQKNSEREINFILWSEADFIGNLMKEHSFAKGVAKNKKIWLAGDEDGFERIVAEAAN